MLQGGMYCLKPSQTLMTSLTFMPDDPLAYQAQTTTSKLKKEKLIY